MTVSTLPPQLGDILVVDDTTANLQLLAGMLKGRGYKVRPAPSGETALRAARASPPDLILLDITMPGMDGFEVCRQLKLDPRLREIPVLFISALDESEDKVKAFEVGGVDYVRKPFQLAEVDARVRTHLAMRRQRRELQEANGRLRELEGLRDSLTHMIAHDMRSPLQALRLAVDGLRFALPNPSAEIDETLQAANDSVTKLMEMITQMLEVSRLESSQLKPKLAAVDAVALARQVVTAQCRLIGARSLTFVEAEPIQLELDPDLIRRVLDNLLGNATKFTAADGQIEVSVERRGEDLAFSVRDDGPGIDPGLTAKIFEKFAQVQGDKARLGSGLGLTFAKMAVEAHGGRIGVNSEVGRGSVFWFTLPLSRKLIEA